MAKVKASDLIQYAEKHLGTSYNVMDCQAYFERVILDAGVKNKDWSGTNAMFRDPQFRGCLPISIMLSVLELTKLPAGTVLFIWKNDGKEPAKYKSDGQGNCSHIGIYDGAGHAIHSSSSKGQVVKTSYDGKSEINGGWNYAAFPSFLEYDAKIEAKFNQMAEEDAWYDTIGDGKVVAENGQPVNVRSAPNRNSSSKGKLAVGTEVSILHAVDNEWLQIEYGDGKSGYMMRKYVEMYDEVDEDDEDELIDDDSEYQGEIEEDVETRLTELEQRMKRLENEWEKKMGWG